MLRPPAVELNISKQLLFFFAAVMLTMLALLVAFAYTSERMDASINQIRDQTLVVNEQLHKIRHETTAISAGLHDIMLNQRADRPPAPTSLMSARSKIQEALNRLSTHLNAYDSFVKAYFPDEADIRDKILAHAASLTRSATPFANSHADMPAMDTLALRQEVRQAEGALLEAVDEALKGEQTEMSERTERVKASLNNVTTVIWASFFVFSTLFAIIAVFITRRIISRINHLRMAASRIGDADLTVRINDSGHDELSGLAQAFDDTTARLEAMMHSRDLAEEKLRQLTNRLESLVLARTQELHQAKEQAEYASQAKTKFLSSMSHELRTPLNAISGFGQMLRMDTTPEAKRDEYLDIILQNSHSLLSLIDQVLVLSSIADTSLGLTLQPVSLSNVIDKSLAHTIHLAREYGVKITDETNREGLPLVMADEEHLVTIVVNLLNNAIKYNRPQDAWVTIRDETTSSTMHRIIITDNGLGFVEEHPGQILEPFERLENYGSTIEGAGVGLTIANSFLNNIHGEMGYHSTPGKGSAFWIDLPLAQTTDQTS